MKYFAYCLLFIFLLASCSNQKVPKPPSGDKKAGDSLRIDCPPQTEAQSTPELLMESVFCAAQQQYFALLPLFCAPNSQGSARRICSVTVDSCGWFIDYFANGTIQGNPRISGETAEVDMNVGASGTILDTMHMVRINAKWFLMRY